MQKAGPSADAVEEIEFNINNIIIQASMKKMPGGIFFLGMFIVINAARRLRSRAALLLFIASAYS